MTEPYHTVADSATPSSFTLWQHSRAIFDVNDIEGFTIWLTAMHELHAIPRQHTRTEHARLGAPDGAIVTLYHSGAVRITGTHTSPLLTLLAPLVINPALGQGAQR